MVSGRGLTDLRWPCEGEFSVEEEAFEYAAQYNALMHSCLIVMMILI